MHISMGTLTYNVSNLSLLVDPYFNIMFTLLSINFFIKYCKHKEYIRVCHELHNIFSSVLTFLLTGRTPKLLTLYICEKLFLLVVDVVVTLYYTT